MHIRRYLRFSLPLVIIITFLFLIYTPLTFVPEKSILFVIILILLLSAIALVIIYITIERPLQIIQNALDSGNTDQLQHLRVSSNRFNRMAELVIQSFEQQKRLSSEISERKKAVKQRTQQEKEYRTLFETAPDAIVCIDDKGTIILSNRQANYLLAADSNSGLVGENIQDYLVPDAENEAMNLLPSPETLVQTRDCICTMKDATGRQLPAQIRLVGTELTTSPAAILVYFHDLTGQKEAEAEKRELEEKLRESYKMEAIGQLAGGIAHDYNNIHGAISGYADLICQRYNSDARLKKYASMILSASNRASELTRKLLTFARKNKLNLEFFDAADAIADVVSLLQRTIDKSITVIYRGKPVNAWIYGDTIQLQNAIVNLALNARDAMPDGGEITIATSTLTVTESYVDDNGFSIKADEYYSISVSDTGCGIDETTRQHLFEPFYTTKDTGNRSGLGLASVYGTLKSHKGFIDITSTPSKGTTFTLNVPITAPPQHTAAIAKEFPQQGNAQILLVDDENFLRDALREMLIYLGHTVTVCASGFEALSLYNSAPNSFDLVILDMKMPEMSGLECFNEMKKVKADVRALLSTGYSIEDEESLLREGIRAIIHKPYITAQLAKAVKGALSE